MRGSRLVNVCEIPHSQLSGVPASLRAFLQRERERERGGCDGCRWQRRVLPARYHLIGALVIDPLSLSLSLCRTRVQIAKSVVRLLAVVARFAGTRERNRSTITADCNELISDARDVAIFLSISFLFLSFFFFRASNTQWPFLSFFLSFFLLCSFGIRSTSTRAR